MLETGEGHKLAVLEIIEVGHRRKLEEVQELRMEEEWMFRSVKDLEEVVHHKRTEIILVSRMHLEDEMIIVSQRGRP